MTANPKLAFQRSPTGLTLFGPLPETTDFYLLWLGPGAGLKLAIRPFSVDGTVTSIQHRTANGAYNTWREAAAAAEAFARWNEEDR